MIFQGIITGILSVINFALSPLELLNWAFTTANLAPLKNFLGVIYYILPIAQLKPIIYFIISMFVFRIGISLVKTIFDIVPFV